MDDNEVDLTLINMQVDQFFMLLETFCLILNICAVTFQVFKVTNKNEFRLVFCLSFSS